MQHPVCIVMSIIITLMYPPHLSATSVMSLSRRLTVCVPWILYAPITSASPCWRCRHIMDKQMAKKQREAEKARAKVGDCTYPPHNDPLVRPARLHCLTMAVIHALMYSTMSLHEGAVLFTSSSSCPLTHTHTHAHTCTASGREGGCKSGKEGRESQE